MNQKVRGKRAFKAALAMVAKQWNTMKKIATNVKSDAQPTSNEHREMLAEYNCLVRIAKHRNKATLLAAKTFVTDLSSEDSKHTFQGNHFITSGPITSGPTTFRQGRQHY